MGTDIRIEGLACQGPALQTTTSSGTVSSAPTDELQVPLGPVSMTPTAASPLATGLAPPGCRKVSFNLPAPGDLSGPAVGPAMFGNPTRALGRRSVFQVETKEELLGHLLARTTAGLGAWAVEEILERRAAAYDPGIGDVDDDVDDLFEVLEREGLLIFAEDVDALIADGRLSRFVNDALATMEHHGDLWQLALVHGGGDEAEAVRLLAVAFQDNQTSVILGRIDDPDLRARTQLALERLGREHNRFPPEVKSGGVLYHYYVIRLLAARLVEKRKTPPERAFAAALILNSEYEIRSLEMRSGVLSQLDGLSAVLAHVLGPIRLPAALPPENPDVFNFEATVRDIYLGYAGAWRGAGLTGPLVDYATFRARFVEDPEALFRSLVVAAAAE